MAPKTTKSMRLMSKYYFHAILPKTEDLLLRPHKQVSKNLLQVLFSCQIQGA